MERSLQADLPIPPPSGRELGDYWDDFGSHYQGRLGRGNRHAGAHRPHLGPSRILGQFGQAAMKLLSSAGPFVT